MISNISSIPATKIVNFAMMMVFLNASTQRHYCRAFSSSVLSRQLHQNERYTKQCKKQYATFQTKPLARKTKNFQMSILSENANDKSITTTSLQSPNNNNYKNNESIRNEKEDQLKKATKLSLAPMMEYTDRHFRHVVRLISSNTLLYTEMVAANALAHERADGIAAAAESSDGGTNEADYDMNYLRRFLGQGMVKPLEGPSVLQLGGSDPAQMLDGTHAVMDLTRNAYCDYTALNLNCGCPSPKVAGKGCFGAALMEDPTLVKNLVQAMHDGCDGTMPITVKCRIGTDEGYTFTRKAYDELNEQEEYTKLCNFIETVASGGIATDFQIHARIAVLGKSFSPADNRKVPPLKYDVVRRLVQDYPELTFSLNGGVTTLMGAKQELETCPGLAGVMIGRGWTSDPWSFATTDEVIYGEENNDNKPRNRLELLQEYGKHADLEEQTYDPLKIRRFITKAVSGLFTGETNAKKYRIALDDIGGMPKKLAKEGKSWRDQPPISELILEAATKHLSEEVLLRSPKETYEMMIVQEEIRLAKSVEREDALESHG